MAKGKTLSGLTYLFMNLSEKYCKRYHISMQEFYALDEQYRVFEYIDECKHLFNEMTWLQGVISIKKYIDSKRKEL